MLCDFDKTNKEWICKNCGRRAKIESSQQYMPTAKCRIPENYRSKNSLLTKTKKGVGNSLSEILKKINIDYDPMSVARRKIMFLNNKSSEWCYENIDLILKLMKEEAIKKRIPYVESQFLAIIRLAIIRSNTIQ